MTQTRSRALRAVSGLLLLALAVANGEEATRGGPAESQPVANVQQAQPLVVTQHTLTIGNHTVRYRVTAGYLPQKDASGDKTIANIFFIAYVRADRGVTNARPITFAFNGGPGSSSVWLHMGALGPKRVLMNDAGETLPPPYQLADNPWSWLDDTDLVFIDPVSTGYSRTIPGTSAADFHGYEADVKSVGDFIRLYATRYDRWAAPKFIVGESYGGLRAVALSQYLQERYGMYLNGIVLISPTFDFQSLTPEPGNDLPYALYLPTYAAAAWFHHRLHGEWARSLGETLSEAERFARQAYMPALLQGDALPETERRQVVARLADLTGLSESYVLARNLRIEPDQFQDRLLIDDSRVIGRYDARVTGIPFESGDYGGYDPSYATVVGGFTAGFNRYVRDTLKFDSDLPYEVLTDVSPWKMPEARYLHGGDTLRRAMIKNNHLHVWIVSGYFDLAVPYFAVEQTLREMNLDPAIRANIRQTCYAAGHMVYTVPTELAKLKSDYQKWLSSALDPRQPPADVSTGCDPIGAGR